jgi:hypothetical protein
LLKSLELWRTLVLWQPPLCPPRGRGNQLLHKRMQQAAGMPVPLCDSLPLFSVLSTKVNADRRTAGDGLSVLTTKHMNNTCICTRTNPFIRKCRSWSIIHIKKVADYCGVECGVSSGNPRSRSNLTGCV